MKNPHHLDYHILKGKEYFFIPDSLKEKHRKWVSETISNASYHLSAGRYKNVDETIRQIERTAKNLFSEVEDGLLIWEKDFPEDVEFIPYSELGKEERDIYLSLKVE
ncbi:hypothetical protein KC866_00285 [Patescibacteria group bacterium]|nr:hypothetical protein [Patescibacteria group bacterium]